MNNTFSAVIALWLMLLMPCVTSAKVTFKGDFESGDLKGWGIESPGGDSCRTVTDPVRSGRYAVRMECTKDQKDVANSKRCEIVRMNSGGPNNANRDCWFGWSLYIPADWEIDPNSPENVTQWHELPDTEIGETWRSPPLALAVKGDQFLFHLRWDSRAKTPGNNPEGTKNLPAGKLETGKWIDWVLHIRWSFQEDGLLEVWRDGQKILTHNGPNGYNDRRETYFKAGVYKWEWKSNPKNSITTRRVIYVDEVKFGDKDSSYDEVAPRGSAAPTTRTAQGPLYLDPSQPLEKRVADLMSRLTLEEKAALLNHRGPGVERLRIKSDKWNQCLHGVWWTEPTTMFPVSIAMAATWDPALVHEVATAISDEARGIYNGWHQDPNFKGEKKGLIYRAPVINISRNPYWGRINECYGEDPFLTSRIGVAYVKGLQGDDPRYLKLVSTLKHYAVNNVEKDRQKLSASVDERMLHEYWLPHFRACIVEGQAQSIMASYNAINGVPSNINRMLLTDILKTQWGFQGFVVSDLGGVKTMVQGHLKNRMSYEDAVAQSLNAGCDFSDDEYMKYIPAAVRQGLLPEARLNDAVYRVMRDRFRLGEFDPPEMVPYSRISPSVICSDEHRKLSLRTARESIVLLSNRGDLLPLDRNKLKSIAVIGPHADMFTAGGYSGKCRNPVAPLAGIRNRAAQGTEILYAKGCEITAPRRAGQPPVDEEAELRKAAEVAKKADVAIVYVGTTLDVENEGRDRTSLNLPGRQEELIKTVLATNPRTVVVEMNAGPLAVPWVKEHAPAIIEAWWAGEEGGNAIADVIFGDVNPAGRMPLTVYESDSQVPPQDEYDITRGFTYMYLSGKPLFAFGHGLSYTQFRYSNLQVSPKQVAPDGQVTVSVDIENIGQRDGDEVAQLYVHDVECAVKRPARELRGFQRIHLKPSEKKKVSFTLKAEQLAYYDVNKHGFVVGPGAYDIELGASSDDIRVQDRIDVKLSR